VTELLLGCGFSRVKHMALPGEPLEWKDCVTLDRNPRCKPDLLCDMDQKNPAAWYVADYTARGRKCLSGQYILRINDDQFDEVHAYEVLEHLGAQGDETAFFNCFDNIHCMLRAGGHLFATCPSRYSPWLWGDPSHRRVISAESLAFLDQRVVASNRKNGTAMSDFSDLWTRDFRIISTQDNRQTFAFCLQAIK
jgi:hypothetical protein